MTDQRNNDEPHRPSNAESQSSTMKDFDLSERPSEGDGSQASTIRDFPRDDTIMTFTDHTKAIEKDEEVTSINEKSYTPSIGNIKNNFCHVNIKLTMTYLLAYICRSNTKGISIYVH